MKQLTAVILAAGVGERFWPFTGNKVLFPFFGKTFFDWALRNTLPDDVTKVVILSDPKSASVFRSLRLGKPTIVAVQKEPGTMADALLTAASELKDTALFVIIADDLVDSSLYEQIIKKGLEDRVFGVIPAWKTETYFPGGYLSLSGTKVTGITEKPAPGKEPSKMVYISGNYIAESDEFLRVLGSLPKTDKRYELALTKLATDHEITFFPYEGKFSSLKYPWNVLDIMNQLFSRFASHVGKNVQIAKNVTIHGDVYVEDNVKIMGNTTILGPTYIGKNTIIGSNNLIRQSHIGSDVVTGFNTDVTRSYIGDRCWFHSNYIGDSVMSQNISMGSGAVLANLRLDEGTISSAVRGKKTDTGKVKLGAMIGSDVRIGVNASIMPGIKIGRGSFVGAGVILQRDLPEDSFCAMKPSYTVEKNTKRLSAQARENFKKNL